MPKIREKEYNKIRKMKKRIDKRREEEVEFEKDKRICIR